MVGFRNAMLSKQKNVFNSFSEHVGAAAAALIATLADARTRLVT